MSTLELERRAWTKEDKRRLIELWTEIGSITLIAILLDRPEGSVQTEASRINLPRRQEDKTRHRKKWAQHGPDEIDAVIDDFRESDGRIRIIDLSNALGRSIDAVAARMARKLGTREAMRAMVVIPDDIRSIKLKLSLSLPFKPAQDTRKVHKMRNCLTCTKPFYSEGAGNRICPRCKSEADMSDWD